MRIKLLALLTGAAVSLSTAALADGPGFLRSADLNQDGTIDQSEFQTSRDKWFQDLDANHDGFVSADELKAFGEQMRAKWAEKHGDANAAPKPDTDRADRFAAHIMKRVDTDQDGRISKAEFDTEGAALFKRMDKNADGKIASDEMRRRHHGHFAQAMFQRVDTDQDGKITKAEFAAAGDRMFQKLDANGDGVITPDEMKMQRHGPDDGQAPDGTPDQPPAQ